MQKKPNVYQQFDCLNLSNEIKLKSILQSDESIKYSTEVEKFNQVNKAQTRIFLLTDKAIYNLIRKQNIIKSIMSKLVKFNNTFTVRRRIPLAQICGITDSKQKTSEQFVIHVKKQHDYRYRTNKKIPIIKAILKSYMQLTKQKLAFYFRENITLVNYCTTKTHLKDNISWKPKDQPMMFDIKDLIEYELPKIKFQLVYSVSGKDFSIDKFLPLTDSQINQDFKYFTLTTVDRDFQDLLPFFQHKNSVFVALPHYCYTTKSKSHLFSPLKFGGKLSTLLKDHGPFSPQLTKFYTCQLILALQYFHSRGFLYRTLSLDKVYLKENGYICLQGINRGIIKKPDDRLLYSISGLPSHIAPEMAICKGYSYQADIWSLGVCIVQMLTGQNPFLSINLKGIIENILVSENVAIHNLPDFINKIFKKNPQQRIKLNQLKNLNYFKDVNWESFKYQTTKALYKPQLKSTKDWSGKLPSIFYLRQSNNDMQVSQSDQKS